MAEEYGQAPSAPFGDIYLVQTPKLDELGQRLYQQGLLRRQAQMQESKEMDAMMGKELTRVRGIDAPMVNDKYQTWKQLRKQLYFDPSVMNDPKKYNDIQMRSNALYGDLFRNINESAEANANAKEIVKERAKNPYAFSDNVGDVLSTYMNTPIDALDKTKHGDLTDIWGATRYQGANFDFQKVQKQAEGQLRQVYTSEAPVDASGLQTALTPYKFTAAPAEYKASIMGAIAGQHNAHDSAVRLWRQIPQATKDQVDQQYAQITPEKWQQTTGQTKPQNLDPANPDNEAEQYVSFLAKQYAINATPEKGTPVFRTNINQEMRAKIKDQELLESYKQNNRIDLAKLKQGLKDKSSAQQDAILDDYFNTIHDTATKGGTFQYKAKDGSIVPEHKIPIDPMMRNMFKIGEGKDAIYPDEIHTDANGTYVRPVYYKRDAQGQILPQGPAGLPVITELSQPISRSQFKVNLGAKALSKKDERKEIGSVGTPSASTPYNIQGKTYTHKQLNDMGYSDQDIEKGKQLGNIK